MRSAVIAAIAASACGSGGSGVDIEVVPPAGTMQVELLVAPEDCSDAACNGGISWTTAGPQGSGTIYEVDSDTRDVLPVPASGKVRFQLRSSSDHPIDRIAVIGFDANGTATALHVLEEVAVPTDHAEIWKVDLDPLSEVAASFDAPPDPGTPTERAHVWRAPAMPNGAEDATTYPSCVLTQEWDDTTNQWERDFIVPDDRDCDNQAIECNAYWFDYDVSQTASPCATEVTADTATFCALGDSQCADGASSSNACTASSLAPQCLPDALCGCSNPSTFQSCVRAKIDEAYVDTSSALTYANCDSFAVMAGTLQPCTSSNANELAIVVPPGCAHATLYSFSLPAMTVLASDNGMFTLGNASFQMQTSTGDSMGCVVSLQWQSGTPALRAETLLLDVLYTGKHVLLPVKVGFEVMPCPTMPRICPLVGMGSVDHLFDCAK